MSKRNKDIIKILLFFFFLITLAVILIPLLNTPEVEDFVRNLGIFSPIAVIFYIVLSHMIAPLIGSPGFILAVTLFGYTNATILLFISTAISSAINFWISRRFGREWVTKFVGKKNMEQVDRFALDESTDLLVLGRLFGSSIHEYISYAFGLTSISFKKYYAYTMLIYPVPMLVTYFVFRNLDFTTAEGIIIWVGSLAAVGLIFGYFINKYIKRFKKG